MFALGDLEREKPVVYLSFIDMKTNDKM